MRLVDWSSPVTILLDFVAWFIIHLSVAGIGLHLPGRLFEQDGFLYKCRPFENGGRFWEMVFHVRRWKERLPDGSVILGRGFAKKQLQSRDTDYFVAFVKESRRAELTHWITLLTAPLFFLWNPPAVGFFMILFALFMNGPCIIAQRYNRPRFQRLLSRSVCESHAELLK